MLISEGSGHVVEDGDFEVCAAGAIELRSVVDFSVMKNYFEANGADITVRNLPDLIPSRVNQTGRIIGNTCESPTGVAIRGADKVYCGYNRVRDAFIAPICTNVVWENNNMVSGSVY